MRDSTTRIESFPGHPTRAGGAVGERVPEGQVRPDGVLDVEEIALGRAILADHRRPTAQGGNHGLGHEPGGVGIAAAVDVREPGDGNRELPREPI